MSSQQVTSTSCSVSSQTSEEQQKRKESDDKRTQLKAAWDKKWKELTQNGQLVQTGSIPPEVEAKVKEMFDELKPYMRWNENYQSAASACSNLQDVSKSAGISHVKVICRVLVKIVYWMGGLKEEGKNKRIATQEEPWVQYLRCVMGNEIILRILKNKCKAKDIMEVVARIMREGGSKLPGSSGNSICSWITGEDITNREEFIGTEVQQFLDKAKKGRKGGIEGFNNIVWWMPCGRGEKEQEELDQKAKPCNSERIMDLLQAGRSHQLRKLVEPPAAPPQKPANAVGPSAPPQQQPQQPPAVPPAGPQTGNQGAPAITSAPATAQPTRQAGGSQGISNSSASAAGGGQSGGLPPPSAPSFPHSISSSSSGSSPSSSISGAPPGVPVAPGTPKIKKVKHVRKKGEGWMEGFPFDSIHPYLPLVPSILGIMTITYFLWKVI